MPGGVGGARSILTAPYPDSGAMPAFAESQQPLPVGADTGEERVLVAEKAVYAAYTPALGPPAHAGTTNRISGFIVGHKYQIAAAGVARLQ